MNPSVKLYKKIASVLIAAVFAVALSITVFAENPCVDDSAGLFTADEIASIEERVKDVIAETGVDIVIVTARDVKGKTSQAYADDYFDYNGYGKGEEHNGILLLINMEHRQLHISQRGSGTYFFDDSRTQETLDKITPLVSAGNYDGAVNLFLDDVSSFYKAGVRYENGGYGPQNREEKTTKEIAVTVIVCLLIGAAAGGIACAVVVAKYKMKVGGYKYPFRDKGSLILVQKSDVFTGRHVTKQKIQDDNHRGPTGGSSMHTSASGESHRGSTSSF